jgi:hypothetical protein
MNLSTIGSGRRELLSSETKVDQNGEVQGEQFWPQLYGAFQRSGLDFRHVQDIDLVVPIGCPSLSHSRHAHPSVAIRQVAVN